MNEQFKNTPQVASKKKQQLFELLLKDRGIELPPLCTIARRDLSKLCPLSAVQERLWYEWRYGLSSVASNEVILLEVLGQLNAAALLEAFNEVARRHEILRTRFVEIDGELCQDLCLQVKLDLSVVDLSHLSAPEQEARWRLLAHEQAHRAFNLEQPPLISGAIIVLRPNAQLLMLTMHKMICDAQSRKILVNELGQLYKTYLQGALPRLPELAIQYSDFAYWQRSRLQSGEFHREIAFWQEKLLDESPSLPFAADKTGRADGKSDALACEVKLSEPVSQRIRQVIRHQAITPYMILLAGWQALIGRHRGQQEITVATVVANRERSELEDLIGPLSNTVLIRLNLSGNPSFADILANVKKEVLAALEHQELPYEWVVKEVAKASGQAALSTPNLMFIMEEPLDEEFEFGGLKVTSKNIEQNLPAADLTALMRQNGERFEGRIVLGSASLSDNVVELAAQYERLIETVAADLNCRIGNLPPLSD
ncbi:MAG: hypothetical protein HY231_22425 [Acidobacteria bacterium]|nr:hypothetical protein [Acidobacteriota bacterium]